MMSEVEDSEVYGSESCDLHQDRHTWGTLMGGSMTRRTSANIYSQGDNKGKDQGVDKGLVCP